MSEKQHWMFALAEITTVTSLIMCVLVLYLVDNFGRLAQQEQVKREVDGPRLLGDYGNAVTAMSVLSVVFGFAMSWVVGVQFWRCWSHTCRPEFRTARQKMYFVCLWSAIVLGWTAAGLNLHMTENFFDLENIEPFPNPPVGNENYKLRGAYGKAVLGVNSAALAVNAVAYVWIMAHHFYRLPQGRWTT